MATKSDKETDDRRLQSTYSQIDESANRLDARIEGGGPCSVEKLDENTPNAGCDTYERSLQLALEEMR